MPSSLQSTEQIGRAHRGHPPIQIAQAGGAPAASTDTPISQHAEQTSEKPQIGDIPDPTLLLENAVLAALLLLLFAFLSRRNLQKVPRGLQNIGEFIVETIDRFVVELMGHHGRKYVPFAGTLFLFIFVMNVLGDIPGFHAPTSNLTYTFALGLTVFCYVQWEGIRARGLFGYIKHFSGPPLPLAMAIFLKPLLFVIEVISELFKPITLSVRLFGNIFGEDVIILVFASLFTMIGLKMLGWFPLQFPVLLLAYLTDFVQALVFMVLACIYLALMTHEEEMEEEESEQALAHAH
ncbi:MAG TPA: F0F1 ATP synthase subunit A [Chthonomonas sp.]|jgi:F-type H+-transporting ATPase subunit a|uniref:F0F1 ATP synthase subunit A n=1 Tax=Chthonomonas sp. TaxID=2282153 RepID=UPI002B4B9465|nr:F0F1 ATP synthase subunit A [Chthonomonas sp.]HLH80443.1 F0F1 ATP synthase subunit A [Chthonomonas sp.]